MLFPSRRGALCVSRRVQETAQLKCTSSRLVYVLESIWAKVDPPEISCDNDQDIFDIL